MNKHIVQAFIFFSLTISVFVLKAQTSYEDYVITIKGDSIPCKVKKPLIGKIRYQTAAMSKSQKITVEDIKEYSKSSWQKIYRAVYRGPEPEFMEIIEKGAISIYEVIQSNSYSTMGANGQWNSSYTSTTDWYFGKKTDTVTALKTSGLGLGKSRQQRKDLLGEMLKDKPEIYNKYMADDKFTFKQLRKLIHLYNTGQELTED